MARRRLAPCGPVPLLLHTHSHTLTHTQTHLTLTLTLALALTHARAPQEKLRAMMSLIVRAKESKLLERSATFTLKYLYICLSARSSPCRCLSLLPAVVPPTSSPCRGPIAIGPPLLGGRGYLRHHRPKPPRSAAAALGPRCLQPPSSARL